jgi:hypothetical protein
LLFEGLVVLATLLTVCLICHNSVKLRISSVRLNRTTPGKTLYFDRVELEAWLRRNRVKTVDEIEREAEAKVNTLGKGGRRK